MPKVYLAKQQFRKFREYLSDYDSCQVTGRQEAGAKKRKPLKLLLEAYKIIVMTPQVRSSLFCSRSLYTAYHNQDVDCV